MITNFQKIRRDGKVIPEGGTAEQMIAAGWTPDKVVVMRWDYYGRPVELRSQFGFLSRIVCNRESLAVLEDTDATGQHASLSLYAADGSLRGTFPNLLDVNGQTEAGEYAWFTTTASPLPTAFAAVFKRYRDGATFRVDIDAAAGTILGTAEVR